MSGRTGMKLAFSPKILSWSAVKTVSERFLNPSWVIPEKREAIGVFRMSVCVRSSTVRVVVGKR